MELQKEEGDNTYLLLSNVVPGESLALCNYFLAISLRSKDCDEYMSDFQNGISASHHTRGFAIQEVDLLQRETFGLRDKEVPRKHLISACNEALTLKYNLVTEIL